MTELYPHPILGPHAGNTIGTGSTYLINANSVSPTDTISCEASATDNNGSTASSVSSVTVNNATICQQRHYFTQHHIRRQYHCMCILNYR